MKAALRRRTRRVLDQVLPRVGLQLQPFARNAWLLHRTNRSGFAVRRLDGRTWLVERPGRNRQLTVLPIGPSNLRAQLVVDKAAVRRGAGRYQKELSTYLGVEHVAWLLRAARINCVLDVGANRGQYAERLRKSGYTGRIVSFEPLPEFVDQLRKRAARDQDWLVFDCALGSLDGTAQINVTPGTISSLLPASEFGMEWSSKLRESRPETITIRRLESVLDEATAGLTEPRTFLKMDTQGYDLETFKGTGERISEILGLQSEVAFLQIYDGMPRFPEQLAAYEAAGFGVTGFFPVTRHTSSLRAIECDLVMLRADAVRHPATPAPPTPSQTPAPQPAGPAPEVAP